MKLKNIFALTLAVLMLASCFVGCGKPDDEKKDVEFNVGSLPIVNEKITLKVLTQDPTGQQYSSAADAGYWKWLEEKTGIHFEVESYSAEELSQKLPLIMADPDQMPDLFIRCDFKDESVMSYGQNGQLLKLNDLIDRYGTNIKAMFAADSTAYGASVLVDGSIYALPAMNGSPSTTNYAINERFFTNCGLELPTTLEELAASLKKMRTMDANGNGIAGDEILWSNQLSNFKRIALSMVGIKCYWPWQGVIVDDRDGEVFFVPTSEEYKYLLTILNDLYENKCLDPEIFTQNSSQLREKRKNDVLAICDWADDPEAGDFSGSYGWTFMTNVTSAKHDTPLLGTGASYQTHIGAISKFTDYPEICMLVLDYMYSKESSIVSKYGLEGVDYNVTSEDPWIIKSVSDSYGLGQGVTSILTPRYITSDMIMPGDTTLVRLRLQRNAETGVFAWQNYVHLTQENAKTLTVINADLGLWCDDYWAGFITGKYDIETGWDAYVAQCQRLRCNEAVDIYQDAYDNYFGK